MYVTAGTRTETKLSLFMEFTGVERGSVDRKGRGVWGGGGFKGVCVAKSEP